MAIETRISNEAYERLALAEPDVKWELWDEVRREKPMLMTGYRQRLIISCSRKSIGRSTRCGSILRESAALDRPTSSRMCLCFQPRTRRRSEIVPTS
jgi:hypothetical protein